MMLSELDQLLRILGHDPRAYGFSWRGGRGLLGDEPPWLPPKVVASLCKTADGSCAPSTDASALRAKSGNDPFTRRGYPFPPRPPVR